MSLEERVAFLEGRVEEQTRQTDGIREAMVHLEERMDRRFEGVDMLAAQVTTLAAVVTAFVAR